MGTQAITMLQRATGLAVEAALLDQVAPEDLTLLESMWSPERARIVIEISRAGEPLVYIDFLEVAPWNWTIPGLGRLATKRTENTKYGALFVFSVPFVATILHCSRSL